MSRRLCLQPPPPRFRMQRFPSSGPSDGRRITIISGPLIRGCPPQGRVPRVRRSTACGLGRACGILHSRTLVASIPIKAPGWLAPPACGSMEPVPQEPRGLGNREGQAASFSVSAGTREVPVDTPRTKTGMRLETWLASQVWRRTRPGKRRTGSGPAQHNQFGGSVGAPGSGLCGLGPCDLGVAANCGAMHDATPPAGSEPKSPKSGCGHLTPAGLEPPLVSGNAVTLIASTGPQT